MSLYRIVITSINNSSVPPYPQPFASTFNGANLTWDYVDGNPPLPTALSALEIVAVNINTGQTERVRLGAAYLTVGAINGLQVNQTYDVQVIGYDVNNDPLAFSRPVRVVIPENAQQGIAFFPILRIQRTLNYVDENYIQVTTNGAVAISVVWAGVSGATQWKLWYGVASQGEYIDTNLPPQQTLSSTNTAILPAHSERTELYVMKVKAYDSNGNEVGTTRTYAFYWTIIVPENPPPPPCSYQAYDITAQQNITNPNHIISFLATSGVRRIRIIASCPFSIQFNGNNWARLFNAFNAYTASFDGNEDFSIHYDENTSSQAREATFIVRNTVNNAVFSITLRQISSGSAPPCTYSITTNPAYNSVRPTDNAYIVIVSANTTSIQVTVTTGNTCRYYFLDQFFQFSSISDCVSVCSGTKTITLNFTPNNSFNPIERTVNIHNADTNELIRRIVVRQLAPVTEYPLPNFVVPPSPYENKPYLLDDTARYDIFAMHDSGDTIEVSLYSEARGVLAVFGFKKLVKITVTKSAYPPALQYDYLYWRLRDSRNTQTVYKSQRFVLLYSNQTRAKFIEPAARNFFVLPNSGVDVTFTWNAVSWAVNYGLYMFSQDVLVHQVTLPNTATSYTYTFSNAQLSAIKEGKIYVELLVNGNVTDQIVLTFENVEPPPPPPPPPPDETKVLDVVEHVFPLQTLTSGDVACSGFELTVWEIYGSDSADVINKKKITWLTDDNKELRVITEAPEIERTVSRSLLRAEPEFPSASLKLTELFPFEKVFDRLIKGESKKQLMYYARLSLSKDGMVYSVAEGIIKLPVSTTLVKFKHATNQGSVNQVKPFSVQLFHPAALFKFTNPLDQTSKSIQYTRTANRLESSGKGVVDYVRNAFNAGLLVKPIDVLDVIMTWLNEASIFAKAGIFDSVRDSSNDPVYYPTVEVSGYGNALSLIRSENSELNVCQYALRDLLFNYIYIESFIHSDSFGDPKTKQKSGELRDYSVELTRGLRGNDGKFPKEEKEFSLLGCQNVMEFIVKLTESCLADVFFVVRRVNNTYRVFMILSREGFDRYSYLYNRQTGGFAGAYLLFKEPIYIENAYKKELGAKIQLVEFVRVSEINGAGNAKESNAVRTELNDLLVYDASKEDAFRAMFSAIRIDTRLSVASAYAMQYVFEDTQPDKISRVLTLPSSRALEQHEREFYVRTALQNIRTALPALTFNQDNASFTVNVYVPTWYLLRDSAGFYVGRYLAEAVFSQLISRVKLPMQTVLLRAKLDNVIEFMEHYTLTADLFNKQVMLKMLSCSYDVVRNEVSGEFEVMNAPKFEFDYSLERVNSFSIRYDVAPALRPRYTIPIRRRDFTYSSGSSVYGDSWKGYRLLWEINDSYTDYSVAIYRYSNNVFQLVHSVALQTRSASTGNEFGLENYNVINYAQGRYLLVLQASYVANNTTFARFDYIVFDVDFGFLNVNVPHTLAFDVKDLAIKGAVRIRFAFAWFATKGQTIVIMSSDTSSLSQGEALCVFVRDGFLHVGKIYVDKVTNSYSGFNFSSLDLSKVPFGGGVHGKVDAEVEIEGADVRFKVNGQSFAKQGYAYSVSDFNIYELSILTNGHLFNVAERDSRYAKVHGEYLVVWSGATLATMNKDFERYFDDDIGKVFVENDKGKTFVDEGKNIAKF